MPNKLRHGQPRPDLFHPGSLVSGSLLGWWDASRLGDGVADGATVQLWRDLSGQGNDLTQPTAGNRPTLLRYQTAWNGRPLLNFTGSHWLDSTIHTSETIFTVACAMVYRSNASGSNRKVLGSYSGDTGLIFIGTDSQLYMNPGAVASGINIPGSNAAWVFEFNGASSRVDTQSNAGGTLACTGTTTNTLRVGAGPLLDVNFDGQIAEVMLWSGALDQKDRIRVRRYLATKYRIGLNANLQ